MTDFVGAPPFIRVTLANLVWVCLLAYKKSAPLSDLASMLKVPLMKCLLWPILTHSNTGIFLPDGLRKNLK